MNPRPSPHALSNPNPLSSCCTSGGACQHTSPVGECLHRASDEHCHKELYASSFCFLWWYCFVRIALTTLVYARVVELAAKSYSLSPHAPCFAPCMPHGRQAGGWVGRQAHGNQTSSSCVGGGWLCYLDRVMLSRAYGGVYSYIVFSQKRGPVDSYV